MRSDQHQQNGPSKCPVQVARRVKSLTGFPVPVRRGFGLENLQEPVLLQVQLDSCSLRDEDGYEMLENNLQIGKAKRKQTLRLAFLIE